MLSSAAALLGLGILLTAVYLAGLIFGLLVGRSRRNPASQSPARAIASARPWPASCCSCSS
jgi:hypothetical protein